MALMDAKKLGFTTAVELSYISKKNQNYIAVAIDSQQSSPSQAQAKRMRELDEKKLLNGDVIDGIMMEDKKEVDKVILTGAELSKYFGKETTPREMKDQIIKLLDDWKGQQKEQIRSSSCWTTGRASRRNTRSRRRKTRRRNKRDFGPYWPEDTRPVGLCPTPRSSGDIKLFPVASYSVA